MAMILAWMSVLISMAVCGEIQDPTTTTDSSGSDDPVPAPSMHRLIPSVIDNVSQDNSSEKLSPGNITLDTSPFLPSGMTSYRSAHTYDPSNNISNNLQPKNFTPSYFIGEVIPEPYIPERFQTSRSSQAGKHISNHQKLVPSQTAFAIHKILPFLEHMKHAMGHSLGHTHEEEQVHVPQVHEPSQEDDDVPKYAVNYENQHSDRPSYNPHNFESPNLHSTKPITFDNGGPHYQQDSPDYSQQGLRGNIRYPYVNHGHQEHSNNHHEHFSFNESSEPPKGHSENVHGGPYFAHDNHEHNKNVNVDHFGHHHHQQNDNFNHLSYHDHQQEDHLDHLSHHNHQQKDHLDHFSNHNQQQTDNLDHFSHHSQQQKDHLDHFSHHDADFVLPSPFYPPELEYPPSHHKDVHYKIHQNNAKNPLHGLLHFAAALIPLGLFVAALQPSVIHVNSSQPMPAKYRSTDGDGAGKEVLGLPGLEVLERLGLGRLDGADCERRAFCELAVLGGRPEGNTAQRGLWKLANSIPMHYGETLGLDQMLKAVKSNSCATLKCADPKPSTETRTTSQKSTKAI